MYSGKLMRGNKEAYPHLPPLSPKAHCIPGQHYSLSQLANMLFVGERSNIGIALLLGGPNRMRIHFSLNLYDSLLCPQVQKLKGMVEQQRYLRLQHLLKQSNIYSKFLLKRMEEQRKRQEKKDQLDRERTQRKRSMRGKAVGLCIQKFFLGGGGTLMMW